MKRFIGLFIAISIVSMAMANTSISPSQYMIADDLVDKAPVHHDVHLQAPNGQQSRVIILGSAELEYEVQVSVLLKGNAHKQAQCDFQLENTPEHQIPTCILDFSGQNEVKKIELNQKEDEDSADSE